MAIQSSQNTATSLRGELASKLADSSQFAALPIATLCVDKKAHKLKPVQILCSAKYGKKYRTAIFSIPTIVEKYFPDGVGYEIQSDMRSQWQILTCEKCGIKAAQCVMLPGLDPRGIFNEEV